MWRSIHRPCSVSTSRSSNRTGGFPASGSRTGVIVGPTASERTPSPGNRAASGTFGRIEVARHMPIARPLFLPTAFQNQGSFARPALPGVDTTTNLSVTPDGRACPSRASRWRSHAATAGASRVALGSLQTCRRHYPGGIVGSDRSCLPQTARRRVPHDGGLPRHSAGSASASPFSRPAQRSLTLRPACSRNRQMRSFPSKAPTASLPPPPLRLLPAGATQLPDGTCTR